MPFTDPDLTTFEQHGCQPPVPRYAGSILNEGAVISFQIWAAGQPVVLLHGGLGHTGNFGRVIPALAIAGYQVIGIDTRGHGHSGGGAPFSYKQFSRDLLAVMDQLRLRRAALLGWSDGAATALVFARSNPHRVAGVYYFGCNMDPSGTKPFVATPAIERVLARHRQDHARMSPTLTPFDTLMAELGKMQTSQPNYNEQDLASLRVPVMVAHAEHDEFIREDHARYLAANIRGARFELLPGVSHFAPLQNPALFSQSATRFFGGLSPQ